MSHLIINDPSVTQWVAKSLDIRPWPDGFSIGVVKDDRLLGASVFHNWYPETGVIEITSSAVTPRWLSREMLHTIFSYPFDHLKCQMVVLRVSENNHHMLGIARRLMFETYTIPRLRGKNESEVICTLTDDQWRSSKFARSLNHG